MREWYGEHRGGGKSGASSRSKSSRNSKLERAERIARQGGSSSDVIASIYGDIPW